MKIIYNSIEVLASFIEMFVLFRIYNVLLYKERRVIRLISDVMLALGGAFITLICNHISTFSYFTMLVFVFYASITAIFLYKINYIVLFSVASFYLLCLSGFDFLLFTFISNFYGGYETFLNLALTPSVFRMIIISIIKFLWIIAYLSIKKYLYKLTVNSNHSYAILLVSGTGFIGFVYLAHQTFKSFRNMTDMWLSFFIVFALLLFTIYFIIESREEKMKLSVAEMRNTLLEENYRTINDIYMSNAKLYHDLNNHLNVLYQLLDENNTIGAKEYIKEICRPIMGLSKTVWTGVDVVDVVINSKLERMNELGIVFDLNVEFPSDTNIKPHDMCTILANLLDNAIEATELLDEKRSISLIIRRINHFILIKISNSCVVSKNKSIRYRSTTKDNKELHGWGLPSVIETVEKYNGTLKTEIIGELFVVKIILFFDKKV